MSYLSSKKPPFEKTKSSTDKTKVSFTEKQARKIFGTSHQNHGLAPFEICKFINSGYLKFLSSINFPFEKTTSSNDKTDVSLTEKQARKTFGTSDQNHGLAPFEGCKFINLGYLKFLSCIKASFEKKTSSNDKTIVPLTEKQSTKIFGTFDQKHGLTPFKICKFFSYSKMSFLSSKKPPFEKARSSNDKTKVSFKEKQARKIFGTADQNHGLTPFKICKFFDYSKMTFLLSKKPPFQNKTSSNYKTQVSFPVKQPPKIFAIFDMNPFKNMEIFRQ